MASLPILTQMRQAVADSLKNYLPLKQHKVFIHEFERPGEAEKFTPDPGRLPMISIEPTSMQSPWVNNNEQEITYSLNVSLWTGQLLLTRMEAFWQLIHVALHKSKPNDSDPRSYIRRSPVIVNHMVSTDPSTVGMMRMGEGQSGPWVCYAPIKVTLKGHWDPINDDETTLTDLLFPR